MMSVEAVNVKARKREEQNRLREIRDALSSSSSHSGKEEEDKEDKERNTNKTTVNIHPTIIDKTLTFIQRYFVSP